MRYEEQEEKPPQEAAQTGDEERERLRHLVSELLAKNERLRLKVMELEAQSEAGWSLAARGCGMLF